jgi:hypothetical protein
LRRPLHHVREELGGLEWFRLDCPCFTVLDLGRIHLTQEYST